MPATAGMQLGCALRADHPPSRRQVERSEHHPARLRERYTLFWPDRAQHQQPRSGGATHGEVQPRQGRPIREV